MDDLNDNEVFEYIEWCRNPSSVYVRERFPNAKFSICCFDNDEEMETKLLTNDDAILFLDDCEAFEGYKLTNWFKDFYLIRKKEGQSHIRYCDVIDQLIENGVTRYPDETCDTIMSDIIHYPIYACYNDDDILTERRNSNSLNIYTAKWDSSYRITSKLTDDG